MKSTEKYQVKELTEGYIINSYSSPVMDTKFHDTFKVDAETKKDVEIYYIDLGDLLVEKG